jgi:polyisoprenyl-phosphate glycosyltransferase
LPLTIFYTIAFVSLAIFVSLACFTFYHKLFTDKAIPGWTSTLMTGCFFGSMNALGIAILGEYVSRIYNQVRARPLYLVAHKTNFDDVSSKPAVASKSAGSGPEDEAGGEEPAHEEALT